MKLFVLLTVSNTTKLLQHVATMNFLLVFDVLKGMYLSRDQLRFVERRIPGLLDVASSCVPMKSWTIMFQRWLLAQVLYLHNWHIGQR